jgi:hypothetical protein
MAGPQVDPNPDFDLDKTPIDYAIGQRRASVGLALGALDDDPDDAARAQQLSKATGVPGEVIHGDLENFEAQHKAALTGSILNNNPWLRDYVSQHPIAASVSNDDWGQLDETSQAVNKLGSKSALLAMQERMARHIQFGEAIESGFKQGFGPEGPGSWMDKPITQEEADKQGIVGDVKRGLEVPLYAAGATLGSPFELGMRAFSGLLGAGEAGYKTVLQQQGVDPDRAEKMVNEASLFAQLALLHGADLAHGGMEFPHELNEIAKNAQRTAERIKPYVEAGTEVPFGVDSATDLMHTEQSKLDLANLKDALAAAQKSATRERDPDLFASFIRQHTDATIGISSEAVRKLYGDSTPMPDDGLLGWVPGIEDQLIGNEATGGDIRVPLADWLARVDPDVAKELHDSIRVRGNGLTLEEGKEWKPKEEPDEVQPEPKEGEPSPLAVMASRPEDEDAGQRARGVVDTTRSAGGLEPMQTFGEKKVLLQKVSQGTGRFANVHDFDLVDESGKRIGDVQLTYDEAKKDLHVEYIRASSTGEGAQPNFMGPAATRGVLRQLQKEFPEARTISGSRVSGAREQAATARGETRDPMIQSGGWSGEHVSVPLSRGHEILPQILDRQTTGMTDEGHWVDLGQGIKVIPKTILTDNQRGIVDAVNKVFETMAPRLLGDVPGLPKGVRDVEALQSGGHKVHGLFANFTDKLPFIMWSHESKDAVGSARHEVIHFLRHQGFFSPDEWGVLRQAAVDEGWLDKFNIRKRYGDKGAGTQLEEAVAEGFAHWYRENYNEETGKWTAPKTPFDKVMVKLGHLYVALRSAIRDVLGYHPDFEDLFSRVESGEVGSRRGVEPINPKAFRSPVAQRPNEPELPGMTRMDDREIFEKASAVGMTVKQYQQVQELIAKRDVEDTEFAKKQNEKDVARRHTLEWKENAKRVRGQVREELANRPDVQADQFLREGVLYGQKIKGRPRLDSTKLTDEQKAALPADYHTPGGIHPDDVARLHGYPDANAMVGRVSDLVRDRGDLGSKEHFNKLVEAEVESRMRLEHGDLAKNILEEAQDHVISQTQFDLLHEQTLAMATLAGKEMSLTKADVKSMVRQQFQRLLMDGQTVDAHLRDSLKAANLAERAYADQDYAEAFRQQQKQYYSMLMANEAKALAKEKKRFDKLGKKYSGREVKGVEPDFTNYIHQLMQRFGINVRRSAQDVSTEIEAKGTGSLKDFVDSKNSEYGAMALDDRLYDPKFNKKIDQMSVYEFHAVSDAFTVLNKAGMDEKKVIRAGDKEDLADLVNKGVTQLETFPLKEYSLKPTAFKGLSDLAKHYMTVGIINAETWLNRWDRDNLHGVFNQWLVRPLTASAYRERTLGREYSKMYKDLGEIPDKDRLVQSPFIDPLTKTRDDDAGRPYSGFTRENVAAMISNAGNPYNWDVLTKGHDADPHRVWQWLTQNSTKEDWVRAEKMGKIFNRAFEQAQDVYRNIYGVAPPKIELTPFDVRFANGETFHTDGWYHPIIRDPNRTNMVRAARGEELLDKDKGLFPSIANGYTKQRTGKLDVLALDHNSVVSRLDQVIHDVAFRAEVIEANKLVKDKGLRKAIRQYYGDQYVPMLDNWLSDIAGASNTQSGLMAEITRASNYARTNMIGSLIGFNPGTVMKHGPTALVNSMYEVGLRNFTRAFSGTALPFLRDSVSDLFVRGEGFSDRQLQFIWDNSEAIRNRAQNWEETIGGAHKVITGKPTLRDKIIQWGSKPVALSDMISAMPTWLAAYKEEFANTGDHGNAVFAGDRAVRRAHGDVSVTNLPELVRRSGPFGSWLTTLYGFFSTQMQRRAEIAFQTNDIYKLGRDGEIKAAASNVPKLTALMFSTLIWPTVVEEYVNSIGTDDHRGPLTRAFMAGLGGLASSFLYFRDLAHGISTGQEASVGMASTPAHDISSVFKEAIHPSKSMDRQHAAKTVSDWLTVFGEATGMFPKQAAKVVRFGLGTRLGTEHPKGPGDVAVGLMRGTAKRRVER